MKDLGVRVEKKKMYKLYKMFITYPNNDKVGLYIFSKYSKLFYGFYLTIYQNKNISIKINQSKLHHMLEKLTIDEIIKKLKNLIKFSLEHYYSDYRANIQFYYYIDFDSLVCTKCHETGYFISTTKLIERI